MILNRPNSGIVLGEGSEFMRLGRRLLQILKIWCSIYDNAISRFPKIGNSGKWGDYRIYIGIKGISGWRGKAKNNDMSPNYEVRGNGMNLGGTG